MAEDNGQKEEKFDFDSAGQAAGYISLDQARVLAMRSARETPGEYGRRFRNVPMAFEVVEDEETEDHYVVTLSFRPQGQFVGVPGQEQFFIEKEGNVAHRQVLSLPAPGGGRRLPMVPIAIGLAAVIIAAVAGGVLLGGGSGSGDGEDNPVTGPLPSSTPVPNQVPPSPTPIPQVLSATSTPTLTPTPTPTPGPVTKPDPGRGPRFTFQYVCINRTLNPCLEAERGFAQRVFDRTNGQVEIQITSFPELGIDGSETLRLVADGKFGMIEVHSSFISSEPPIMEINNLYGLYADTDTQLAVILAVRPGIEPIIQDNSRGIVLGYNYYPNVYIYSKKPLVRQGDFQGLRIGSHNSALTDLLDAMGAEPTFLAFNEVYTALERGVLDAAVGGSDAGFGQRWYEVTDYLVGPIVSLPHSAITVNRDNWNKLPVALQTIIREEVANHEQLVLKNAISVWETDAVKDNLARGMTLVPLTAELEELMKRAAIDRVLPNWVERSGGPNSRAGRIFNDRVAPIVGVKINRDGTAQEIVAQSTGPKYRISINGVFVQPRQATAPVANGAVTLLQLPDDEGKYAANRLVTLEANPAAIDSNITWSGVDSQAGNRATVSMDRDREIGVLISPPADAPASTTVPLPGQLVWYFERANPNSALADPRVRTAIDFAIEEAAVDQTLLYLPNWPSLDGAGRSFDPVRAKQLLAEAGCPDGFGRFCVVPITVPHMEIAIRIAGLLRAVLGIDASLNRTSCSSGVLAVNNFDSR